MNFDGGTYMAIITLQIPTEVTKRAKAVQAGNPKNFFEFGTARGVRR